MTAKHSSSYRGQAILAPLLVSSIGFLITVLILAPSVVRAQSSLLDEALRLNQQAFALYQAGKYSQAEPLYRRSLEIREKVLGPEHPDVAASLNNLAGLYDAQGRYAQAEP